MNTDWNKVFVHGGIEKNWVYQTKAKRYLAYDYLEKARNVIQDFEDIQEDLNNRANVVYAIMLMTWMFDALKCYKKTGLRNYLWERDPIVLGRKLHFTTPFCGRHTYMFMIEY